MKRMKFIFTVEMEVEDHVEEDELTQKAYEMLDSIEPEVVEIPMNSEDIKCDECGSTSSAEDWDKATQKVFGPNCIKIMDAINDNMDDDHEPWFICPQCEEQVELRQVYQL